MPSTPSIGTATAVLGAIQRLSIERSWGLFFQFSVLLGSLVCLAGLLSQRYPRRWLPVSDGFLGKWSNRAALLVAGVAVCNYVCLVGSYLGFVDFADPAEANVAAVSWLFQNGSPLYPALDATERVINNYGPFLYILLGLALKMFQPSFFSVKLVGCWAGLGSLLLMFFTLRHRLGGRWSWVACGVISLSLLSLTSGMGLVAAAFWVRPDALLLFGSALGLAAVVLGNRISAIVISAIALGVSTNLKITAVLHFLPIYGLLALRFGLGASALSILAAALVSVLPFTWPQISFADYVIWLRQVGKKGMNVQQIGLNFLWIAYVAVPIGLCLLYALAAQPRSLGQWIWRRRFYIGLLSFGIGVGAVSGATYGALENNLLPFIPVLAYLVADLLGQPGDNRSALPALAPVAKSPAQSILRWLSWSVGLAFVCSLVLTVYSTEAGLLRRFVHSPGHLAIQDIQTFAAAYPHSSIAIGYGFNNYPLSTYRPALVFAGQSYFLDSASLMEMQASGMENTPPKTLAALRNCQTQIWLIPKDEPPFKIFSYYAPIQRLFNPEFQQLFLKRYERRMQTAYYDAWFCRQ